MKPVRVGVLLALIVAGPPLYGLVQSGQLSGTAAVARGAVVAGVLVVGFAMLQRLIDTYREQHDEQEKIRIREEALRMLDEAREAAAKRAEEARKANEPPR